MTSALPFPDALPAAAAIAGETPERRKAPTCATDTESLCSWVWDRTHSARLARLTDWDTVTSVAFLSKVLTILGIVVAAFVLRWVTHRAIARITGGRGNGKVPTILRPLKERAPEAWREGGILSERRRQRASTIGSVLRSISSAAIFGVAAMLVLSEVGINLAPLIASAGIAGVAIGFGAQNLVKDFLSGMFMMLEDQYGVGDVVDLGEASGTVEAVGLRVTTVRDAQGVVWYIRNGEVIRVGNKSQGWAVVNVDIPVPFGIDVDRVQQVMQEAANALADEEEFKADLLAPPEALGVEQITATGMMLRVTVKTTSDAQWRIARELRARLTDAVDAAGIAPGMAAPPPTPTGAPPANGTGGAGPT